jgi:hypothetical protein
VGENNNYSYNSNSNSKGNVMKKWNHFMLFAAVTTMGVSLSAQTCQLPASVQLTANAALLASPRYREEHPELLRAWTSDQETPAYQAQRLVKLTENAALANSPRFLEEHPELLRAALPEQDTQASSKGDRLRKLTENKALAASPRFREKHPELLRIESVSEAAP